MFTRALVAALLLAAFHVPSAALAADQIALPPDGKALYETRCATCHDNAVDRTPARAVLARNTPSFIVGSLTNGAMAPMAGGLTPADKVAIASYITGAKPPANLEIDAQAIWGPTAVGTPPSMARAAAVGNRRSISAISSVAFSAGCLKGVPEADGKPGRRVAAMSRSFSTSNSSKRRGA